MFRTVCPHCSQEYTLDDSLRDKTACCKQCRQVFVLEEKTAEPLVTPSSKFRHRIEDSGFELRLPSEMPHHKPLSAEKTVPSHSPPRFSASSGLWNVGDVILGIYEVRALSPDVPYAEGGVGVVHRVYHREWDKELAVKSPKPHVFQTESGKLNYEREAQTWIELGLHPNIVTCYLVRRISEIPRLFAEFIADGSLKDWMQTKRLYEGGPEASLLRILDIAAQFAWGLEYAHQQKLLHLDVKPANVMMSGQTAKVTDFGLAQGVADDSRKWKKDEGTLTESKSVWEQLSTGGMTPGYCSPEQYTAFALAQKGQYDQMPKITLQSDIWSWAVSILSMFHGRAACKKGGQTARQVLEQFVKAPAPTDGRPEMPKLVAELLFRCFEEQPDKRPESIGWVADEVTKIYKEVSGMQFPRLRPLCAAWTPESINNRAVSMLDLNKPKEAMKLLEQAASIQPWHPEVTYNQTLLAWRTAKITDLKAVKHLETLFKTRPQSAEAGYALGLVQQERGNPQSAMDALEEALRNGPRENIHQMYRVAQKTAEQGVRCLERFTVNPGMENEILADDGGEYVLVPSVHQTLELRETVTGRIKNTFTLPKESSQEHPNRIAISTDLLWELVYGDETKTVFLKRIGAASPTSSLRLVAWKRYFSKKESGEQNLIIQPGISYFAEIKETQIILYDRQTKEKIAELFGHEDAVTAFCFSSDGRFAVSGGLDKVLILWEISSKRCLRTLSSSDGAADAVYFGKNNRFVLSLAAGGSLRLWDVSLLCGNPKMFRSPLLLSHIVSSEEMGRQQSKMNQCCGIIRDSVRHADFDAALQAVENAKTINGWETARRTLRAEGIWDVIARHTVRDSLEAALCTHTFTGHQDTVSTVALSLDGNWAASAGRDQNIRVWNIAQQKCVRLLEGHYDWVRSIAMTMDAKFLVSGSWDMSVRIWNISTGQCVRKLEEKIKSLTKIALNPQGRIVAVANGSGSVFLWDVLTDEILGRFLAHNGSVNSIQFCRNGQFFVTGGDDALVALWKLGSDEPIQTIKTHKVPVTAVAFSADLSRIVSADRDGHTVVWNVKENKKEFDFEGHYGDVTGLEILADSRFFLSCAKDKKIRFEGLLRENRAVQRFIEGHSSPLYAVAADVAGHRFITGGEDALVRVWDLYWNYRFPGWTTMTVQAEKMLKILLSLYAGDKEPPKIDEEILKRILLEMEYRGFGNVLPEEIRQRAEKFVNEWSFAPSIIDIP